MKTIWRTITILITGAVLLGAGYWTGSTHGLLSHMWTSSVVSQSTTRAAKLSTQLGQINDGKIDDMRNFINVQLDAEIVTLGTLIDWKNPTEDDLTAIKILRTVAKQRKHFGHHNSEAAVSDIHNRLLEKAIAYPTHEKQTP